MVTCRPAPRAVPASGMLGHDFTFRGQEHVNELGELSRRIDGLEVVPKNIGSDFPNHSLFGKSIGKLKPLIDSKPDGEEKNYFPVSTVK